MLNDYNETIDNETLTDLNDLNVSELEIEEQEDLIKDLEDELKNEKKSSNIYVNNSALLRELELSRQLDCLTDNAVKMFQLMAEHISRVKKYDKYPEEKYDCIATAMMKVCLYWRSFKPEKYLYPNPFAYFTSAIVNGLAEGWNSLHPENKKAKGVIFTSLDNNIHSL